MKRHGILLVILAFLSLAPQAVMADILVTPIDIFLYGPVLTFILNYFINLALFSLACFLFIRPTLRSVPRLKILAAVLILTSAGFFADLLPFWIFSYRWSYILHFIITFILLWLFNYLVARYYLKAPARGSLFVGIFMGILTNPYLLWIGWSFYRPYSSSAFQFVSSDCTDGNATILIKNIRTRVASSDDIIVTRASPSPATLEITVISPAKIEPGGIGTIYDEDCGAGNTCTYNILTSLQTIGPIPVQC